MNYVKGDLLSVNSGIIVHGCNAQGVMGSGVAKVIRAKYPDVYKNYIQDLNIIGMGEVSWCHLYVGQSLTRDLAIASAITQEFYGNDGEKYVSYDAIDSCMDRIFSSASESKMLVSMPKIGAGLGGGSWKVISEIISDRAKFHKYHENWITVYEL